VSVYYYHTWLSLTKKILELGFSDMVNPEGKRSGSYGKAGVGDERREAMVAADMSIGLLRSLRKWRESDQNLKAVRRVMPARL